MISKQSKVSTHSFIKETHNILNTSISLPLESTTAGVKASFEKRPTWFIGSEEDSVQVKNKCQ